MRGPSTNIHRAAVRVMGALRGPGTGQSSSMGPPLHQWGTVEEVAAGSHTLGSCMLVMTHSMTVHPLTRAGQGAVKAQMRRALDTTNKLEGPLRNSQCVIFWLYYLLLEKAA